MLALAELQTRMRDVILGGDAHTLQGVVADDRLGHAQRLNVYRNNTTILLREALGANFPVVQALVGDDFFAVLCRSFVRTHPPQSPCLFEYGGDFAAFIDRFPSAQSVPYLGDVARLEWAQVEALHAAGGRVLSAQALSGIAPQDYDQLVFTFHPAFRLVTSPYPVHSIWAAHQPGANPEPAIALDQGGEAVLITRPGTEVGLIPLTATEGRAVERLSSGMALLDACADVPAQNLSPLLATLLIHGALSGCTLA